MSTRILQYLSYSEYLQTPHWREVRAETLRLAGGRCILCGRSDRPLSCHHTDDGYRHLGEEVPGVDTCCLCQEDHEALSIGRQVLLGQVEKGSPLERSQP